MTAEEVDTIFSLADVNKDGKLDYAEVKKNQKKYFHHFALFNTFTRFKHARCPNSVRQKLHFGSFSFV